MNRISRRTTQWALALAGTLATPILLAAQEAEGGGGSLFSINWGLSIWTLVVFVSLLFVLGKFAWGPILENVEAREKKIRAALDEAAERQAKAEALAEEQRKQLAEARREAQDIIAEGREAGERVRRDIEEKAREEGQNLVARARKEIGREKEAALDELRHEAVELALAAASKLLHAKMDAPRDRELVLGYLEDLSEREREASAAEKEVEA